MNSDEIEYLSEKNINSVIKKIQALHSTLSQVVMTETNDTTLKGKLMEIFRMCCQFSTIVNEEELMEYHIRVRKLLTQVEESTAKPTIIPWLKSVDRNQRLKLLFDWVQKYSTNLENVEIMHHTTESLLDNAGFGLKVTKDMKRGDEVFKIPKNLILTAEYFLNDSIVGEVATSDPLLNTMPNILLAFGLLIECYKKNDSPWKVYLDSLPSSYNNICEFSVDDFAMLKGSPLYWDALSLWTSCVRQYVYLHIKFIECETTSKPMGVLSQKYEMRDRFNVRDYFWAASTVMTRMNPIPLSSKSSESTLGLIPVMDLCNHTDTIFSVDFDVDQGVCKVLCPTDLKKGDELRIFYGTRPTSLLFIYNGFYPESNINDFFIFSVDRLNSKADISNRIELLTAADLQESFHHPLSLYSNAWSGGLRLIYRLLNCSADEKKQLVDLSVNNLKSKANGEVSLSLETELKSLNKLKTHIQLMLDGYPSEDSLPTVNSNNYISVNCERYIKNEKKILEKVIEDLDTAIKDAPALYLSEKGP